MMKLAAILSGLPVMVAANPLAYPQDVDFYGLLTAAGPPVAIPMATGVYSQVVTWNAAAAAAAAAAEITAEPLVATSSADYKVKRKAANTCSAQPVGYGPKPTPDTASAFLADKAFSSAALSAPTPAGYVSTFTDLHASSEAYGYLGFTTLTSYDVDSCAAMCDAMYGCVAINIYFERDPTVNPAAGCANPASTTEIKCAFWGSPVTAATATNDGQYRDKFHVVIAGSNGFVNESVPEAYGYNGTYLGDDAIFAPLDCNGDMTYMGYKFWNDGLPFDVERCAAACTAQSAFDIANPPATGLPVTCQFFNTYLLVENGVIQGQVCALYNETWGPEYATNSGYTYEGDVYTIEWSYSFSNTTDPGDCVPE